MKSSLADLLAMAQGLGNTVPEKGSRVMVTFTIDGITHQRAGVVAHDDSQQYFIVVKRDSKTPAEDAKSDIVLPSYVLI